MSGWKLLDPTTYSEYVIPVALPLQQWLRGCPVLLRYTYIACLAKVFFCIKIAVFCVCGRSLFGTLDTATTDILTILRAGRRGIVRFTAGVGDFSLLRNVHTGPGSIKAPFSGEVKNEWSFISISSYAFVAYTCSSECALLGYNASCSGNCLLAFWDNLSFLTVGTESSVQYYRCNR